MSGILPPSYCDVSENKNYDDSRKIQIIAAGGFIHYE